MFKRPRKPIIQFKPFSLKQLKILTWWCEGSPYKDYNGIIADGAIRAGKTVPMGLSFVMWAMDTFSMQNFGMCGKSIGAFKRNVWWWLKPALLFRGYKIKKVPEISNECFLITFRGRVNYFYIFGGKDERSQDFIQGITLAGIFFDEVALMPESFVNQGVGRCSVKGAKWWFNCNPDSPLHWFNVSWILQAVEKRILHLHFRMEDNPSMDDETLEKYRSMFKGVFFQRFILGLWKMAQGAIYDMFDDDKNTYSDGHGPDYSLWYQRYFTIDKGTVNPTAFLEIIEQNKYYYVESEYFYDSKREFRQKEDSEYADDLVTFIGNKRYSVCLIDPSAANFKLTARQRGVKLRDADNEVLEGIMLVASLLALGKLKINRDKCPNLHREITSYIWDEKAAQRGEEKPVKQNDHGCDALRYFCKTIVRYIMGVK
jgi:PBSX family phage terminase large subunit